MARYFSVFLCFVYVLCVNCRFAGGTCRTVNGGIGTCMTLSSCEPFMSVMRDGISNPVNTWMLRQAHCGFDGSNPKVCCPNNEQKSNLIEAVTQASTDGPSLTTSRLPSTTTLPLSSTRAPSTTTRASPTTTQAPSRNPRGSVTTSRAPSTTARAASVTSTTTQTIEIPPRINNQSEYNYDLISLVGETCTTIYNTVGSCKEVFLCNHFLAMMPTALSNPLDARILRQAHCGFAGIRPKVCCPLPGQPTTVTPPLTTLPSAAARTGNNYLTSLPEPPVCGVSRLTFTKVVNGVPAKLGAFPWMALLAYRDLSVASGMKWRCGGSLVSMRHVLTAAHCIHNLEDELIFVRLGELDYAREDEGATPTDVQIKDMIKHERYTANNPERYDIGVLVLQRDVQFTDLIKPICLPLTFRTMTFEEYNPFVAGWGNINRQGRSGIAATHLQVAQLPVLEKNVCEEAYHSFVYSGFSDHVLCAGYMGGMIDACTGDSGGPLMQPMRNAKGDGYVMYCIGVVSFGRGCAEAGSPGVYTRVTHYLPWLEQKLLGKTTS